MCSSKEVQPVLFFKFLVKRSPPIYIPSPVSKVSDQPVVEVLTKEDRDLHPSELRAAAGGQLCLTQASKLIMLELTEDLDQPSGCALCRHIVTTPVLDSEDDNWENCEKPQSIVPGRGACALNSPGRPLPRESEEWISLSSTSLILQNLDMNGYENTIRSPHTRSKIPKDQVGTNAKSWRNQAFKNKNSTPRKSLIYGESNTSTVKFLSPHWIYGEPKASFPLIYFEFCTNHAEKKFLNM